MASVLKTLAKTGMATKSINGAFDHYPPPTPVQTVYFDDFWPFPGVETAFSGG